MRSVKVKDNEKRKYEKTFSLWTEGQMGEKLVELVLTLDAGRILHAGADQVAVYRLIHSTFPGEMETMPDFMI